MDRCFSVRRFDWWTKEDEDYNIPDDWDVSVFDPRFDHESHCAHCGQRIGHEEAHGSEELHTVSGWPMRVCFGCFDAELKRRIEAWEHHQEVDG